MPVVKSPFYLMPHEWLFGGYLLVTSLRLVVSQGAFGADTLVFLGVLAGALFAAYYCNRHPTERIWRIRLFYYPIMMNVAFQQMRTAVPSFHPETADGVLNAIDVWLIGQTPALLLQPLNSPWLTELFSICYILFFPYLLFSIIYYFGGSLHLLKSFTVGLFSLYGIGFLGYTLLPAGGPYVYLASRFDAALEGWLVSGWNAELVRMGSSGVDVFPSLHVAVSSFLLFFDRRHKPWRYRAYLVPCVGLWLSTLYLRYHYLVDVIFGFALAALSLYVARRFELQEREKA